MYTATLTDKKIVDGKIVATVSYTNGADTLVETISFIDVETFKRAGKSKIDALNATATAVTNLSLGTIDTTPTQPTLTQAQIDEQAWMNQYAKWVRIKTTLIDTGILTGSETALVNLLNQVKTGFKASYVNDIL